MARYVSACAWAANHSRRARTVVWRASCGPDAARLPGLAVCWLRESARILLSGAGNELTGRSRLPVVVRRPVQQGSRRPVLGSRILGLAIGAAVHARERPHPVLSVAALIALGHHEVYAAFTARRADGTPYRAEQDNADHPAGGQQVPDATAQLLSCARRAGRISRARSTSGAIRAMNGMKIVSKTAPITASRGYRPPSPGPGSAPGGAPRSLTHRDNPAQLGCHPGRRLEPR